MSRRIYDMFLQIKNFLSNVITLCVSRIVCSKRETRVLGLSLVMIRDNRWLIYPALEGKIRPHVWDLLPSRFSQTLQVFSYSLRSLSKLSSFTCLLHSVLLNTSFSQLSGYIFIFTSLLLGNHYISSKTYAANVCQHVAIRKRVASVVYHHSYLQHNLITIFKYYDEWLNACTPCHIKDFFVRCSGITQDL